MASLSTNRNSDAAIANFLSSAVDDGAITQELEAICNHRQFSYSRKNREFLRYVVSETLAGRGADLKERTLGIKLYNRPLSYDTGSDSVVRVRASDLRKRLSCYYEERKTTAGWRIQLPLHSYVPTFHPEPDYSQPESLEPPPQLPSGTRESRLPLYQMMQPTLIVLFLCAATIRWEIFPTTPYMIFWSTLLRDHSSIELILDSNSSNPQDVSKDDVNLLLPLQQTANTFQSSVRIDNSASILPNDSSAVRIHVTHGLPHDFQGRREPDAAYITVNPGNDPVLWIRSESSNGLQLAVNSISGAENFPDALRRALNSRTASSIRIVRRQGHLSVSGGQ